MISLRRGSIALLLAAAAAAVSIAPSPRAHAAENPLERPTAAPAAGGVGIAWQKQDDGKLIAAALMPGGPGEAAGVRSFDVLLRVDDQDATAPGFDVVARLRGPVGSQVKLTLDRGGRQIELTLRRADLTRGARPPGGNDAPPVRPDAPPVRPDAPPVRPDVPPAPPPVRPDARGPVVEMPNPRMPAGPQDPLAAVRGDAARPAAPREGGQYKVPMDNMAFQMFPELKTAPAPAWVRPGLRITMYNASASVPGSYNSMPFLDPDGELKGKDGQRYTLGRAASASGHGFTQLDILHVHRDAIAIDYKSFLIFGEAGPVILTSGSGGLTPPGCCADWWVNPDVVRKNIDALAQGGNGIRVSRLKYRAAGVDFNAAWTAYMRDNASSTTVVDLQGGLTLHNAQAVYDPSASVKIDGQATAVGGRMDLSRSTLVSVRELKYPWVNAEYPEAVRRTRRIVYEGVTTITSSGTAVRTRHLADSRVTGWSNDFLLLRTEKLDESIPGVPPERSAMDGMAAAGEVTPYHIAPDLLAGLRKGQVIDQDPLTKVSTVVAGGDNAVVILSQFTVQNGARLDHIYDRRSGWRTAMVIHDPDPLKTTHAEIRLKTVE